MPEMKNWQDKVSNQRKVFVSERKLEERSIKKKPS
jgi:hypothetical protein